MYGTFANKLMPRLGEYDRRVCGTLCVFFDGFAQFLLNMGLKGLSDVDLFAADLVPHIVSFLLVQRKIAPYQRAFSALDAEKWQCVRVVFMRALQRRPKQNVTETQSCHEPSIAENCLLCQ
jgi:hypothetical protein